MAQNPNTRAEATVTLNGKQAEMVLDSLRDKAKQVKEEIKKAEAANDSKQAAKLRRELDALQSSIRNVQRQTYDYTQVLKNINGASIRDLEKTTKLLNAEIKKLTPATVEFVQKTAQLEQVKNRLKQLNTTTQQHANLWQRVTNGFNKYFGIITTVVASLTGLGMILRKLNQQAAQMDDTYADVMKTTEMTRKEVVFLNEEFKKFDTRTTREKLNLLARDAGKLGLKAKKDILDFVEAGNQINVALGEDLGEDAIKQIGKMVGVFERGTKHLQGLDLKTQMLAVGSVVNELGASSTANEKYLVAFAGRLGGISKQAKIAITDIMGFGSALDQDMQAVEMSATALQKFIMKLMGEPAKFAEMAGLEIKAFTKLLETDANQAIKTVLKGLNDKGGFRQLIPIFKDMGLDGARAVGVLSTMAGSIGKIDEAQTIANKALIESVSITNEYNIKNENQMAKLEKAKKRFKDMAIELGEKLNPAMLKFTNASSMTIKTISVLITFFSRYGQTILKTLIVISSYIAGIKLQVLWNTKLHKISLIQIATEKAKQFLFAVSTAATQLYAAATMLLAGNIKGATQAMRIFHNVLKTSPLGLVLSLVAAVGVAIYTLATRTKQAADTYKVSVNDMAEATKKHVEQVQAEKQEINNLIKSITNVNTSVETRKRLINQLKEKYPEYLKFIDTEKVKNEELKLILDRVNSSYKQKFQMAALQGKADAFGNKIVEMETRRLEIAEEIDKLSNQKIGYGNKQWQESWQKLHDEDRELLANIETYTKKVDEFASAAQKIKTEVDRTFTIEGLKDQITAYDKKIEQNQRLIQKSNDDAYKWYQSEINQMQQRKALLQEQLDIAVKLEEAKNAGNEDSEPDPKDPDTTEDKKQKQFKARLKALQEEWDREKLLTMQQYEQGKINYINYKKQLAAIDESYNIRKADIEEAFNQSGASSLQKALNAKIKALETQEKQDAKILEERQKHLDSLAKIEQDYENSLTDKENKELSAIRKKYDKIIELSKQAADRKLITEDEHLKEIADLTQKRDKELQAKRDIYRQERADKELEAEQKLQDEKRQVLEKLNMLNLNELWSEEIQQLQYLHLLELITEEEFQQAMATLADKYRDLQAEKDEKALEDKLKGIRKVLAAAQTIQKVGSDMVGALQQAETERMNAEYEKRLTAAGDNADEREKIEEERAKEEIEIQKKYADANFALQVLQIGVSGVLAGMEAYKALAGIPIVGPALGAAAAAAVGITTIAQIAKAKAERDKVKAISYHGSGSTGSSTKERVITGIEQGGYYDVEREQDSKHFNAHYNPDERGFIGKPSILVAENGAEFVANNQAINNPTIKPVLDIIDIAQKSGSITSLNLPAVIKASKMQGYQKGGYIGSPPTVPETKTTTTAPPYYDDTELKKTLTEMKELLIHLKIYGVKAPIVLSEIEKMQSLKQKSDNLGNRN